ncbi:hypothetical protein D6T69_05675 [Tenacibaculum singaporense]|uniref:Glycosyl hydrolase family 32 N-terminal domain-containing protein n=1 Tax=Tenacibaculum singaporense TaxID=2358479 RepID=A0A3S8R5I8_9FLAO|nr:hypothetical protein [Tenacibaculum singaporense]AZJ35037.1 hypothetical protein D6T69_05675 [Tenacibaculum singaporense]
MKLTRVNKIPKTEIVHYYSEGNIIKSKFNKVDVVYNNFKCKISLPIKIYERFFGLFRLTRRALRLDKCNVFPSEDKLVIIRQGKVYSYDLNTNTLKLTLQLVNCRNILHQSMCRTKEGNLFFGEYGNNGDRKPVNIYKSSNNGISWELIYQFKSGEVKHIHGCYYDPFEDKVWTLTGDFENENIIMKSDESFTENIRIGDGSQTYRAVSLFFEKDYVHWIMDSPIERSYHYKMNRDNYKVDKKSGFPGPVWYLKYLKEGYYLAATSVEIGEGVLENNASLFISKDLENWTLLKKFKKDILPMRYFKWGVIGFADGKQSINDFILHFEALKKVDGKSYIFKLETQYAE